MSEPAIRLNRLREIVANSGAAINGWLGHLGAGGYGVICPMIETASDVESFVAATSYPPRGRRSMGPIRAPSAPRPMRSG